MGGNTSCVSSLAGHKILCMFMLTPTISDEADVFLESRYMTGDPNRNALVSGIVLANSV